MELAILEALQSIFTQNVLLLLGVLWSVLISLYFETRTVFGHNGIFSAVSVLLFALGILSLDFTAKPMNQFFAFAIFIIIVGVYALAWYRQYFRLPNLLSLVFAGRQGGAFQLSFVVSFIQNKPDLFGYVFPFLLILNGLSFAIRFVKNHFSRKELPFGIVGVTLFLIGLNLLFGFV